MEGRLAGRHSGDLALKSAIPKARSKSPLQIVADELLRGTNTEVAMPSTFTNVALGHSSIGTDSTALASTVGTTQVAASDDDVNIDGTAVLDLRETDTSTSPVNSAASDQTLSAVVGTLISKRGTPAGNGGFDDADGNLIIRAGDVLQSTRHAGLTYRVEAGLGTGSFGAVVSAVVGWQPSDTNGASADTSHPLGLGGGSTVAIKVVRNHPAYRSQAALEIHLLTMLARGFGAANATTSNSTPSSPAMNTTAAAATTATDQRTSRNDGTGHASSSRAADLSQHNHHHNNSSTHMRHIVRLLDHFIHQDHMCLVFEYLPATLLDIVSKCGYKGLPLPAIRSIMGQTLLALHHLHVVGLLHCDVKPENVMLCGPDVQSALNVAGSVSSPSVGATSSNSGAAATAAQPTLASLLSQAASRAPGGGLSPRVDGEAGDHDADFRVRLIDFGSAGYEHSTTFHYVQSRFYRAPEVMLGLCYDGAVDIWSAGCMAAELFTGLPLFPGCDELDCIKRITMMCGWFPEWMMIAGSQAHRFFTRSAPNLGWPVRVQKNEPPAARGGNSSQAAALGVPPAATGVAATAAATPVATVQQPQPSPAPVNRGDGAVSRSSLGSSTTASLPGYSVSPQPGRVANVEIQADKVAAGSTGAVAQTAGATQTALAATAISAAPTVASAATTGTPASAVPSSAEKRSDAVQSSPSPARAANTQSAFATAVEVKCRPRTGGAASAYRFLTPSEFSTVSGRPPAQPKHYFATDRLERLILCYDSQHGFLPNLQSQVQAQLLQKAEQICGKVKSSNGDANAAAAVAATRSKQPQQQNSKNVAQKPILVPVRMRLPHAMEPQEVKERWLFADLLGGLLNVDPTQRLTAAQALSHPFFRPNKPGSPVSPQQLQTLQSEDAAIRAKRDKTAAMNANAHAHAIAHLQGLGYLHGHLGARLTQQAPFTAATTAVQGRDAALHADVRQASQSVQAPTWNAQMQMSVPTMQSIAPARGASYSLPAGSLASLAAAAIAQGLQQQGSFNASATARWGHAAPSLSLPQQQQDYAGGDAAVSAEPPSPSLTLPSPKSGLQVSGRAASMQPQQQQQPVAMPSPRSTGFAVQLQQLKVASHDDGSGAAQYNYQQQYQQLPSPTSRFSNGPRSSSTENVGTSFSLQSNGYAEFMAAPGSSPMIRAYAGPMQYGQPISSSSYREFELSSSPAPAPAASGGPQSRPTSRFELSSSGSGGAGYGGKRNSFSGGKAPFAGQNGAPQLQQQQQQPYPAIRHRSSFTYGHVSPYVGSAPYMQPGGLPVGASPHWSPQVQQVYPGQYPLAAQPPLPPGPPPPLPASASGGSAVRGSPSYGSAPSNGGFGQQLSSPTPFALDSSIVDPFALDQQLQLQLTHTASFRNRSTSNASTSQQLNLPQSSAQYPSSGQIGRSRGPSFSSPAPPAAVAYRQRSGSGRSLLTPSEPAFTSAVQHQQQQHFGSSSNTGRQRSGSGWSEWDPTTPLLQGMSAPGLHQLQRHNSGGRLSSRRNSGQYSNAQSHAWNDASQWQNQYNAQSQAQAYHAADVSNALAELRLQDQHSHHGFDPYQHHHHQQQQQQQHRHRNGGSNPPLPQSLASQQQHQPPSYHLQQEDYFGAEVETRRRAASWTVGHPLPNQYRGAARASGRVHAPNHGPGSQTIPLPAHLQAFGNSPSYAPMPAPFHQAAVDTLLDDSMTAPASPLRLGPSASTMTVPPFAGGSEFLHFSPARAPSRSLPMALSRHNSFGGQSNPGQPSPSAAMSPLQHFDYDSPAGSGMSGMSPGDDAIQEVLRVGPNAPSPSRDLAGIGTDGQVDVASYSTSPYSPPLRPPQVARQRSFAVVLPAYARAGGPGASRLGPGSNSRSVGQQQQQMLAQGRTGPWPGSGPVQALPLRMLRQTVGGSRAHGAALPGRRFSGGQEEDIGLRGGGVTTGSNLAPPSPRSRLSFSHGPNHLDFGADDGLHHDSIPEERDHHEDGQQDG